METSDDGSRSAAERYGAVVYSADGRGRGKGFQVGGAAGQEAQQGRERFVGDGGSTAGQEALLRQARAKAAAEEAEEEAKAAAAAAKVPSKKPKKFGGGGGGGGFLGSFKQQAAKTKEKQVRLYIYEPFPDRFPDRFPPDLRLC